jgi:hypothetical protein
MDSTLLPIVNDNNFNFGSFYAPTSEGPDILQSGFEDAFLALPVWKTVPAYSYTKIYNLSYSSYGDIKYWFLILLFNNVANPRSLPSKIKLFSLDDLLQLCASNSEYAAFLPTD